ncbi:MAG: MBL fold metallo-hydrolase [Huintestinicola sp.]
MEIRPQLHQFTEYVPEINYSFNQYLLVNSAPALISTGTLAQAERILPEIREILGDRMLSFIIISHFEGDECGGLSAVLREYPHAEIICSEMTARNLPAFGFSCGIRTVSSSESIQGKDYEYTFIDYPGEVHFGCGIIPFEKTGRIIFSSDLFSSFGDTHGKIQSASWEQAVRSVTEKMAGNEMDLAQLRKALFDIMPEFAAVGHGYCLEIIQDVWQKI